MPSPNKLLAMLLVSQWINTRVSHPLHQDGVAQGTAGLLVHDKPLHVERLGHLSLNTHTLAHGHIYLIFSAGVHTPSCRSVSWGPGWGRSTRERTDAGRNSALQTGPTLLPTPPPASGEGDCRTPRSRPPDTHTTQRMMGNRTGALWMIIYLWLFWPWRSRAGVASSSAVGWSSSGLCECPANPRRWSPWAPGPHAHTRSARSAGPARNSGNAAQKNINESII